MSDKYRAWIESVGVAVDMHAVLDNMKHPRPGVIYPHNPADIARREDAYQEALVESARLAREWMVDPGDPSEADPFRDEK
jgi:hypothetical protein